jgi:glycosyltransferase involved in cell wall biosynthesis
MRVAAVFDVEQPNAGGMHTFSANVLAALREAAPRSRHEFVLYAVGFPRGGPPEDVIPIPTTRRYLYRRAANYQARDVLDYAGLPSSRARTWFERSIAAQGVDLVWFATVYAERCDVPFIVTILDLEHVRQPWFPEVGALGEWARRNRHFGHFIPRATRVIVPNEAGRDQVVRYFRIEPERVLCLGHPTPAFAHEAARRDPLPRARVDALGIGARYLFYPAQFWAHKNHAMLLDALATLARDGPGSYELVLVGSDKGQLDHARELATKAGIADLVHFLGFVETDDLVALYQHAHALTYVSFFGPENLPPLEAFALGCPVIAADIPGAREQLGDAALLVPPTDAAGLGRAVRRLEEPALRAELTERGRLRAAQLTPGAYVDGVIGFLDEFEQTRRCWA